MKKLGNAFRILFVLFLTIPLVACEITNSEDTDGYKPSANQNVKKITITGQIIDKHLQKPLPGTNVKIALKDETVHVFTGKTGKYKISVPLEKIPDSFVVLAYRDGYVPESKNLTLDYNTQYVLDIHMEEIPENVVVIEIEPEVHHLGDDNYAGFVNSQFQQLSEGITYSNQFEVNESHLSHSKAEISFLAKGIQDFDNVLLINNTAVGYLNSSPSDGSFGTITESIDISLLNQGSNVLEIRSNSTTGGDYDDFEFSNIIITFKD